MYQDAPWENPMLIDSRLCVHGLYREGDQERKYLPVVVKRQSEMSPYWRQMELLTQNAVSCGIGDKELEAVTTHQ